MLFSGPHGEVLVFAFSHADLDTGDVGSTWTAPGAFDQRINGFRRAVYYRFNAAIQAIAHPAADAQNASLVFDVIAITNALHPTAYGEMAGDSFSHDVKVLYRRFRAPAQCRWRDEETDGRCRADLRIPNV